MSRGTTVLQMGGIEARAGKNNERVKVESLRNSNTWRQPNMKKERATTAVGDDGTMEPKENPNPQTSGPTCWKCKRAGRLKIS